MKQIQRIQQMEQLYDELKEELASFEESYHKFQSMLPKFKELSDYYTSADWLKDIDDDSRGKFPQQLKRGVLSQDAIYLLLAETSDMIRTLQNTKLQ